MFELPISAASALGKLEGIVRVRVEMQIGDPRRLHVTAREVELNDSF
jgi:hypothetical protein